MWEWIVAVVAAFAVMILMRQLDHASANRAAAVERRLKVQLDSLREELEELRADFRSIYKDVRHLKDREEARKNAPQITKEYEDWMVRHNPPPKSMKERFEEVLASDPEPRPPKPETNEPA